MRVFALMEQSLKVNLHMHTRQGDGKLSPDDAIQVYEGAGYDADPSRITGK